MSTTGKVLGFLLIGSVALNLYLWTGEEGEVAPDPECHITTTFTRPTEISDVDAARFIEEYKSNLITDDKILGGIIARAALDDLLCTESCNAIAYELLRDKSGELGPDGNGVFILLKGVNVTYEESTNTITDIRDLSTKNYIGGYWCPPSCTPSE